MAKLSFKNLAKPTPANLRRLGNAMFSVGTGMAVPAVFMDSKLLAGILFGMGALGKFITSLFAEDSAIPDA